MLTERLLNVATGGAEWVLWLLLVLSVISIAITVERFVWFTRRQCNVEVLGATLIANVRSDDDPESALVATLRASPSEEARIVEICVPWLRSGPDAVNEVLSSTVVQRRKGVEQGTVFLGTLGNNAPFIGLFGTVLGVIDAFRELAQNTMGSVGNVMGGIGEALIATAVGILVALPAVVAYNVFAKRAAAVEDNAQALVNLMIAATRSKD